MQFKEIIGQDQLKKKLINTVKENRISHAQLFFGPEGCGKLALAIAYAQYISCQNKLPDDSCGTCPSCIKYTKLIHPDLHFVYPIIHTNSSQKPISDTFINEWRNKLIENPYFTQNQWYLTLGAENKQGIIYTEESAEILRKLSFKTFEAEYKTMIIWLPEKMHVFGANKLLKIIEEPPAKTIFLLVSENPDHILPTILSRIQMVKIPKIDNKNLVETIEKKYDASLVKTLNIAHLADGNYIKAIEIIETANETQTNFENFVNLMRLCYKKDIIKIIDWIDQIFKWGRERQKNFILYILRLIRENFVMHTNIPSIIFMDNKESSFSNNFSSFINEKNINDINKELNTAYHDIEANAYSKTVFLDLAIKFIRLLNKD